MSVQHKDRPQLNKGHSDLYFTFSDFAFPLKSSDFAFLLCFSMKILRNFKNTTFSDDCFLYSLLHLSPGFPDIYSFPLSLACHNKSPFTAVLVTINPDN